MSNLTLNDKEDRKFIQLPDGRYVVGMVMLAEDAENPGMYLPIQGIHDANGYFVLATNGSGTTTTSEGIGYWTIETDFVVS